MRPLLVLALLALPVVAAPVPKAVTKPPPSPDGAWHLVAVNFDGTEGSVVNMGRDWVLGGENFLLGYKAMPDHAKHLNPNFTVRDPNRPHLRSWSKRPAVYEVDGNTLRVAYTDDESANLTECKPGKGINYYVFERVKE